MRCCLYCTVFCPARQANKKRSTRRCFFSLSKSPFGLFDKGRTHEPCRAGPMCPAAECALIPAGRCGHRPLRKDRRARPHIGRRGRRPAVERSGTNALGVRRPVSAAVPRCEAPSRRGLSAQPTGGERTVWNLSLRQRFALPPPSQREARGIRIPLRGGTHGSRPTASDICDRAGSLTD